MSELTISVDFPGSGRTSASTAGPRPGPFGRPPELTDDPPRDPLIEVAVPVHNEAHVLAASVYRLHAYLRETLPYRFVITVADNASTDGTWQVARRLSRQLPEVRAVHLDQKGRGRALRQVWGASEADVVAYMDVDLSTDLQAFLPLIAPLVSRHSDLAIGSRLTRGRTAARGRAATRGPAGDGRSTWSARQTSGRLSRRRRRPGPARCGAGGRGGFGMPGDVSGAMLTYLKNHRGGATWLVAVSNSQSAASIILQTGQPAISMFGFIGSDHAMTVQRLQQLVRAGKLHYVMVGGGGPGGGGFGGGNSAVTSWVTKNCTAVKPADYGGSSSSTQTGGSLYRCG